MRLHLVVYAIEQQSSGKCIELKSSLRLESLSRLGFSEAD